MTVAALYVQTGGVYYGLEDVEPWDEARDARLYAGRGGNERIYVDKIHCDRACEDRRRERRRAAYTSKRL